MTPIARGQAIDMRLWPPCPLTHACWMDNAEHDSGEPVVVAACGAYAAPEDVLETEADVNCMSCLVNHRKYDQDLDEDSPH
jgi:hypothetical protein